MYTDSEWLILLKTGLKSQAIGVNRQWQTLNSSWGNGNIISNVSSVLIKGIKLELLEKAILLFQQNKSY